GVGPRVDAGDLRLLLELIDAMEDVMVEGELLGLILLLREHPLDLAVENLPLVVSPEVVDHHEAAVEQITAQRRHFLIGEEQSTLTRLDHVDERIVEEPFVGQLQADRFGIHLQRCELLEAEGEVQIAIREVGGPTPTSPAAAEPPAPPAV